LGYTAVRKRLRIRKILGNHACLLRDRDILFLEERLRKGQWNIRGIRKEHRKRDLGKAKGISAALLRLGRN
jgi:hypothetical protein